MFFQTKWIEIPDFCYTGVELRAHFLMERFGIRGSALIACEGRCDVPTTHLVDLEDRLAGEHIFSKKMIHFLLEGFQWPLRETIYFQRLLICIFEEHLLKFFQKRSLPLPAFKRTGNDLYLDEKKLSVSIVTTSGLSSLLHFGVNLDPTGAPVKAIGLFHWESDLSFWKHFTQQVLQTVEKEFQSLYLAQTKVRFVGPS